MTILALEFSSARRTVALARDGVILAEFEAAGGRATDAFSLIERVLATAKTPRVEVETLAVGLGPGSYTGIRAAIAVAQGWQLAGHLKLLGISSVDAIAARAQAGKIFGRINVVVDAQRGEFYLATWDVSSGQRHEIFPLKIVSATEINNLLNRGEIVVGPVATDAGRTLFPAASAIAVLAAGRSDFVPGEKLSPIYLRETGFVKAPVPRI